MRNVHLAHPGMFGEIDLSPAALPPQLSDLLAEQDANIRCHPVIMKLSFRVNLSYAIINKELVQTGGADLFSLDSGLSSRMDLSL